jgi:FtsP/CotA-like multicopper oxidase with cupredoxin domain
MRLRTLLLVPCLLVLGSAAQAQGPQVCLKECKFGEDLADLYQIEARDGVLQTELRVDYAKHCVPMWNLTLKNGVYTGTCQGFELTLPTYYYPTEEGWKPEFPGPTLRVRKAYAPDGAGDRIRVKLVNALPPETNMTPDGCNECDPVNHCVAPIGPDEKPLPLPPCCRNRVADKDGVQQNADRFPNCFHGDNTTNLHFHGSHVSPQAPQDFVLLDLQPAGTQPPGEAGDTGHAGHSGLAGAAHGRGTVAVGQYQYDVEPLRWTQPEGSHWYHPHKHGAAALQVGAGMAGALLIEGPFDDWLRSYYDEDRLEERLLVIQQVHLLNFFLTKTVLPQPLVNGQLKPKITMYPGQVQRWRFIAATMEGSAQIEIDFTDPVPGRKQKGTLEAEQIAMDGIQFSPENYQNQPLLPEDDQFQLSPGNRADFLVQAPKEKGTLEVTYDVIGKLEVPGERVEGVAGEEMVGRQKVQTLLEALAPGKDEPGLLTVEIVSCEDYKKKFPKADADCTPRGFPTEDEWPRLPLYLGDIEDAKPTHTLQFALKKIQAQAGQPPTVDGVANPGTLPSKFFINLDPSENRQYDPTCVDITATIGTAEEWTIQNTTRTTNPNDATKPAPFHVFHMHTNPFQVVEAWGLQEVVPVLNPDGSPAKDEARGKPLTKDVCGLTKYPSPIWQDSITLPSACEERDPKDIRIITRSDPGYVKIRQRYEEFTGEFVLHCHFLGHEDRGMMLSVQTVCPETEKGKDFYGVARYGNKPECVPGNDLPAAPRCAVPKPKPAQAPRP